MKAAVKMLSRSPRIIALVAGIAIFATVVTGCGGSGGGRGIGGGTGGGSGGGGGPAATPTEKPTTAPAVAQATTAATKGSGEGSGTGAGTGAGTGGGTVGGGGPAEELFKSKGCVACHTVAEVEGAVGTIGPVLDGLASRAQLTSGLPVTKESVADWIRDPGAVKPGTIMPNLGLSEDEIEKLAGWLMTLK